MKCEGIFAEEWWERSLPALHQEVRKSQFFCYGLYGEGENSGIAAAINAMMKETGGGKSKHMEDRAEKTI